MNFRVVCDASEGIARSMFTLSNATVGLSLYSTPLTNISKVTHRCLFPVSVACKKCKMLILFIMVKRLAIQALSLASLQACH